MRTKQTRPSGDPTAVRFTTDQMKLIEETAEDIGMSKQDVIRLAVTAGAKIIRKVGIDGVTDWLAEQGVLSQREGHALYEKASAGRQNPRLNEPSAKAPRR